MNIAVCYVFSCLIIRTLSDVEDEENIDVSKWNFGKYSFNYEKAFGLNKKNKGVSFRRKSLRTDNNKTIDRRMGSDYSASGNSEKVSDNVQDDTQDVLKVDHMEHITSETLATIGNLVPTKDGDNPKNHTNLLRDKKLRYDIKENVFMCYSISATYRNAIQDFRKYYKLRYLYYNNLEFEVGYLTHEIVAKYQQLLELFHIVQTRYYKYQDLNYAPSSFMIYIYAYMVDQARMIIHLCNMLHEVEAKYEAAMKKDFNGTITAFNAVVPDKDKYKLKKDKTKVIDAETGSQADRHKKRLQRQKLKELKKRNRLKAKFGSTTSRVRRPKKGRFPLVYGWSIEYW